MNDFLSPMERARTFIHVAVAAGVLSGITTIVLPIAALFSTRVSARLGEDSWTLMLDAVPMFGLSYGVHRKSRICATLLLAYFLFGKAISIPLWLYSPVSFIVSLLFACCFACGVTGAFRYHSLLRKREPSTQSVQSTPTRADGAAGRD